MFISELELNLMDRMSREIYNNSNSEVINISDYTETLHSIRQNNKYGTKFDLCSDIETLYYCFSVVLSEVRERKRAVTTAIFEDNPKLSQEKSVLKEKLDAIPEYARLHKSEEQLFQFLEHIQNVKNNIIYLYEETEEIE